MKKKYIIIKIRTDKEDDEELEITSPCYVPIKIWNSLTQALYFKNKLKDSENYIVQECFI